MANRAKEVFFLYKGNHSAMANDGVYEEYKSFNITKEQEFEWLRDIKYSEIAKLKKSTNIKIDFVKACSVIRRTKDVESIDLLTEVFHRDDFLKLPDSTKLYMCEAFIEMLSVFQQKELKQKYQTLIFAMLTTIKSRASETEILCKVDFIQKKFNEI